MNSHDPSKDYLSKLETKNTCFLVYSTREAHIEKVVDRLVDFLSNELNFQVFKLDEARIAGHPLLPDIIKYTKQCDLGIVLLDGLRPNVVLELGMLLANGTPCIILLERNSKINIGSLITDTGKTPLRPPQIKIDVPKHISDISNISWNQYTLEDDTAFRVLIRKEISKLTAEIKKDQSHNHEKYSTKIRSLLRRLDGATNLPTKAYLRLINQAREAIRSFAGSQSSHIFFHIALSFKRRGEPQKALKEVVRGLALDPNYKSLLLLKGGILIDLNHPAEGLAIMEAVYLKYPGDRFVQQKYLSALNSNGKSKRVLKILSGMAYESLIINDLIPIKARALFLTGKLDASLKLLIELCEYDSNQWAIDQVMYILANETYTPTSKTLIMQIERNASRAINSHHIRCYECFFSGCLKIGLTKLAQEVLINQCRNNKPKDADTLNEIAFNFMKLCDYKSARSILQPAIKKYPNHSYLNATWGLYKLKVDHSISAGKYFYSKAISLNPSDMPLKQMAYYQLGKYYESHGNIKEAKAHYKLALGVPTNYKKKSALSALRRLGPVKTGGVAKNSGTGSRRD